MATIKFKNDAKWNNVFAVLDNEKKIKLSKENNYEIDVEKKYNHTIYFCNEIDEKTDTFLITDYNITISYSYNEILKKYLTYIHQYDNDKLGKVETYDFVDNVNLAYRDGSKTVNVYLPKNYDSNKKYGGLYFFDSQNLFSPNHKYTTKNDPYGGWQLDEMIEISNKNIIVVGIETADNHRTNELALKAPNKDDIRKEFYEFNKDNINEIDDIKHGNLENLMNFILNTVHPYITYKYNIDEKNLGLGGSSCGGIAAFLGGLLHYKKFKYILSYSPAFLFYSEKYIGDFLDKIVLSNSINNLPKVHIYSGAEDELEKIIYSSTKPIKSLMINHGYPKNSILETYREEYSHNEAYWRLILPISFEFIK